eukprot:258531-Amorphochlora_amoeboformis.AAC.2
MPENFLPIGVGELEDIFPNNGVSSDENDTRYSGAFEIHGAVQGLIDPSFSRLAIYLKSDELDDGENELVSDDEKKSFPVVIVMHMDSSSSYISHSIPICPYRLPLLKH